MSKLQNGNAKVEDTAKVEDIAKVEETAKVEELTPADRLKALGLTPEMLVEALKSQGYGVVTPVARVGRMSAVSQEDKRVIRLLAKDNPKQKGSAARARFALYRDGMTVAEYFAACMQAGFTKRNVSDDLRYDQEHGSIKIDAA